MVEGLKFVTLLVVMGGLTSMASKLRKEKLELAILAEVLCRFLLRDFGVFLRIGELLYMEW